MPDRPFAKALAVALALVPIVAGATTAWIGGRYADASSNREANVRMIEIAVGILQQTPSPSTRDLRTWAVAVVDEYSAVKLSQSARASLIDSQSLPLLRLISVLRDTTLFEQPRIGVPGAVNR